MTDVYKGMPKRVRVGSIWIKVKVGRADDHEIESSFGNFNSLKGAISLRPKMNSQQLANTFIHECIHAINSESRAGVAPGSYYEIEEDFTHKIANGLCAFWQDNPQAAAWWADINRLESGDSK